VGKLAFVFSGQGAQYSGMGRELCENIPAAAEVFRRLDAVRPGTSAQCFSGSAEELSETVNTQPCMFAMALAAAAALTEAGVRCDMTAGFSLGEIAALAFSGAVTLEDGFRLVCRRGELMQEAAEKQDSGMAAVVKLQAAEVERLCAEFVHVWPVNYNCPGQVSVAGLREELIPFGEAVKAAGGRAIPLKVKGGFHSPFMAEAAKSFEALLEGYAFSTPQIPLYSDYTGKPYDRDYVRLLSRQICSPVLWQSIIEDMVQNGADTFIEIGPGTTLCGMIGKTAPAVRSFHVEDCGSLCEAVAGAKLESEIL